MAQRATILLGEPERMIDNLPVRLNVQGHASVELDVSGAEWEEGASFSIGGWTTLDSILALPNVWGVTFRRVSD